MHLQCDGYGTLAQSIECVIPFAGNPSRGRPDLPRVQILIDGIGDGMWKMALTWGPLRIAVVTDVRRRTRECMRVSVHPHASWASVWESVCESTDGPTLPPSRTRGRGSDEDASLLRTGNGVGCCSILRKPCWNVATYLQKRMITNSRKRSAKSGRKSRVAVSSWGQSWWRTFAEDSVVHGREWQERGRGT